MKKRVIAILLLVVILSTFTGCSKLAKAVITALNDVEETKDIPESLSYAEEISEETESEVPSEEATEEKPKESVIEYSIDTMYYDTYDTNTDQYVEYTNYDSLRIKGDSPLALAVNDEHSKIEAGAFEYHEQQAEDAISMYAEGYDYGSLYYSEKTTVLRSDNAVFSYQIFEESFSGGAHGYYCAAGYNYDATTGKKLNWKDFFNCTDAEMEELIVENILKQYPEANEEFFDLRETVRKEVTETDETNEYDGSVYHYSLNMIVTNRGVQFVFNPYEIAAYVYGMITVDFPYAEYASYMNPQYATLPEDYCYALPFYNDAPCEAAIIGDKDTITISMFETDYNYEVESVTINGKETEILDVYGFTIKANVLHMDGKSYLIFDTQVENDYSVNYMYEVASDGSLSLVNTIYGDISDMANPNSFQYETRKDLLGTYSVYIRCSLDANGNLNYLEDMYTVSSLCSNSTYKLKSKIDLELEGVDLDTNQTNGKIVIPAGSEFKFIRTDGERILDTYVEGYGYVRITAEKSNDGWNYTVNGMSEYDCFDNLFYAG